MYLNYFEIRYIVKETYIQLRGVDMDTRSFRNNVSVKSYDDSLWDHYSIYDNIPYTRDASLNVEKIFKRISGNIIKSYRCQMKEPYEVKHE